MKPQQGVRTLFFQKSSLSDQPIFSLCFLPKLTVPMIRRRVVQLLQCPAVLGHSIAFPQPVCNLSSRQPGQSLKPALTGSSCQLIWLSKSDSHMQSQWGEKALRTFSCPPQQPTLVQLHVHILPIACHCILDAHWGKPQMTSFPPVSTLLMKDGSEKAALRSSLFRTMK